MPDETSLCSQNLAGQNRISEEYIIPPDRDFLLGGLTSDWHFVKLSITNGWKAKMPSARRRIFSIGGSKAFTLPWGMEAGQELSIAAGNRLLLADTVGEVPEDKLLQFFLEHVEPAFERWWETQKRIPVAQGAQTGSTVTALEAKIQAEPPVYDATCPQCQHSFPWDFRQGGTGYCPRCGAHLWFRL
jgi:hypothetical protein